MQSLVLTSIVNFPPADIDIDISPEALPVEVVLPVEAGYCTAKHKFVLEHEQFRPEIRNRTQNPISINLFYRARTIRPDDFAIRNLTESGSNDNNQGLAAELNYAENSNEVILSIMVCYFSDEPQVSSVELQVFEGIVPVFLKNIMDVILDREPVGPGTTVKSGSGRPIISPDASVLGGDATTTIFIVIAGLLIMIILVLSIGVICLCRHSHRNKNVNQQCDVNVEENVKSEGSSEVDLQTAVPQPQFSTPIRTRSSSLPEPLTPESNCIPHTASYQDISSAEQSSAALMTAQDPE